MAAPDHIERSLRIVKGQIKECTMRVTLAAIIVIVFGVELAWAQEASPASLPSVTTNSSKDVLPALPRSGHADIITWPCPKKEHVS